MKAGDYIYWTHVSQRRRTLSLELREGTIQSITDGLATIKKRGGRTEEIALERLRSSAWDSQITEFVEAFLGRSLHNDCGKKEIS